MIRVAIQLAILRMIRSKSGVFCQVAALVAIMLPLLIILGLKYGIVTSMKERLLNNPASMALRMNEVQVLSPERVEQLRSLPGLGFVLPCVSSLYSMVEVLSPDGRVLTTLPVEPTAPGDPLLCRTGTPEPGDGEIVLSEPTALRLGLRVGDSLALQVTRNGRREVFRKEYKVAGVLPARFRQKARAWLPLQQTVAIQEFLVRGLGMPGQAAPVEGRSAYHGVILPPDATPEQREHLAGSLGGWTATVTTAESHPGVVAGVHMIAASEARMGKSAAALDAVQQNTECRLQPWCLPLQARLQVGQETREVQVLSTGRYDGQTNICTAPPVVYVAPHTVPEGSEVELLVASPQGQSRLLCVARVAEHLLPGQVSVAPQLAAILHRASQQLLLWDYRVGALRHPVVEFYSLRLYADSLENVVPLVEALKAQGIGCRAQLAVVEQVLSLERSLDTLFLVICAGAVVGGVISFGMSLYNAAELCRRDYALFQLLGAGKLVLPLVPMVEATVTALLAASIATGLFLACQQLIGMLFAGSVAGAGNGTSLCRMTCQHLCLFGAGAVATALVASGAAALKVLSISPSEILRES